MPVVRILGIGWVVSVVALYLGYRLTNELGSGILNVEGTGDLYIIFAACAPGAALFSWASRKLNGPHSEDEEDEEEDK